MNRNVARYRDSAVFTARIVQLMGKTSVSSNGRRCSAVARATVTKRYWGLPWYWFQSVVLDGDDACGMSFDDGEEYLVSGHLGPYGVVHAGICSRTAPLSLAQVDLRTLDGSHCAAPGGTLLGKLIAASAQPTSRPAVYQGESLALTDVSGKRYRAVTDAEGIFEFRHLPGGRYLLAPGLVSDKYVVGGPVDVEEATCQDDPRYAFPYVVGGRILGVKPPLGHSLLGNSSIELAPLFGRAKDPRALMANIQFDGSFFFGDIPPGEYLLGMNLTVAASRKSPFLPTYYPGTTDGKKATRIRISRERVPGSFDFAPVPAALVPVPVIVSFPNGTLVPEWYATLEVAWAGRGRWIPMDYNMGWSTGWGLLTGVAGYRHRVTARSSQRDGPGGETERCSDPVEVDVKPGAKPIRIVLNHQCKAIP